MILTFIDVTDQIATQTEVCVQRDAVDACPTPADAAGVSMILQSLSPAACNVAVFAVNDNQDGGLAEGGSHW